MSIAHDARRTRLLASLLVFVLAASLRLAFLDRQGLWADEIFSLAMATGHSLEHPASTAQPGLGDYVEARRPRPAHEYKRYLEHQDPPVGPAQVTRAVRLSDTSPPLYYLLLWLWTRIGGTGDGALRGFSACWALACFPFLGRLAHAIGGRPAVLPALVLFSVAPLSLYYSVEGRMYAMVWFLAVALVWLTFTLNQRGERLPLMASWIVVGAAGMLTHYFYAFVVLACGIWLLVHPGRFTRRSLAAVGAGIGLVIAPWYVHLAESFSLWRVTKDWLSMPTVSSRTLAAVTLPWTFVSPSSNWWDSPPWAQSFAAVVFLFLIVVAIAKLKRRVCAERRRLLWIWLFAACAGPFVFDRIMGTYTTAVPRYAIAGMPAALILVSLALSRLRPTLRALLLLLIVLTWLPSSWAVLTGPVRGGEPFRQLGALLDRRVADGDVVVVHSIPSGVLGVARYVHNPMLLYSWVGQLGQRQVPEDLDALPARGRIILVKIHAVGEPAPEEGWLRSHARLLEELRMQSAQVLLFARP